MKKVNANRIVSVVAKVLVIAVMACSLLSMFTFAAAIDDVMSEVIDIIKTVAFWVGIMLGVYGAFQIIMALTNDRAEDIKKNITLIIVAGVLVGFGTFADKIVAALK